MTSPPKVWDGVLRRLHDETPKLSLEAWIHPLTVVEEDSDRLVLLAPSAFHRERIRSHFAPRIGCLASELGGRPIEIAIEVAAGGELAPVPAARCAAIVATPAPSPALAAERTLAQLSFPSTFDNFVTGPGNALAREASLAVAQGRQPGVFPLFLVGDSGIGKSHLARAVVAEARRGGVRALYASAERFTTEFTSSIRARQGNEFRRRYRQECDLLVIDDVQFLSGKGATQLELLHTVEHLRLVGARVVMTGDRLPCRIPSLSPRLASQMAGGLVAELELPDRTLRREILRDKASRGGVALP